MKIREIYQKAVDAGMSNGPRGRRPQSLVATGVNTLVVMHLSEEHRKEAEKNHLNVVMAGHTASDNLGLNLLFDEVMKGQDMRIFACSGLQRVTRTH